jgi:polyisoprenoid-binding protein YceI
MSACPPPGTSGTDGERARRDLSAIAGSPYSSYARFQLTPGRSAILISARSTVGPIEFGMTGLEGFIKVRFVDGIIDMDTAPFAHLELPVAKLQSGNLLYDAELLRRIHASRFPMALMDLRTVVCTNDRDRYQLEGELTFHGVQRVVSGSVTAIAVGGQSLVVDGEQSFDIRDFDVPSPTMLMLKIYPDVQVHLHVEAEIRAAYDGGPDD